MKTPQSLAASEREREVQRQGFQARIDELKAQVARGHRTEAALEEELHSLRHQALHQPPSASASALLLSKSGCDGDAELPDAKRPAPDAHADLRAAMLRVARADPDAFDSLVADVWQQVGKN